MNHAPPVDPLRRVMLAIVAADPEEVDAAFDALSPEDMGLLHRYCGAIVAAATHTHTPREVPNG